MQTTLELADSPEEIAIYAFADDELPHAAGALLDSRKHRIHGQQVLLELLHVEAPQHIDLLFESEFLTGPKPAGTRAARDVHEFVADQRVGAELSVRIHRNAGQT